MYSKIKKWLTKKKLLVIVPLLALAALGISEATGTTYLLHKAPQIQDEPPSQSSGQPSSDKKNSSSSRQQTGGPSSTTGQGVHQTAANDTNGQSSANTSPSQWTTSASDLITLKSPVANSTFKSGGTISGTARVSKVWYRLVDNNSGQIAFGNLSVVNGKFSGTLQFHAYGKAGHLDVYSFNANGAEVNEVSVSVRF